MGVAWNVGRGGNFNHHGHLALVCSSCCKDSKRKRRHLSYFPSYLGDIQYYRLASHRQNQNQNTKLIEIQNTKLINSEIFHNGNPVGEKI